MGRHLFLAATAIKSRLVPLRGIAEEPIPFICDEFRQVDRAPQKELKPAYTFRSSQS